MFISLLVILTALQSPVPTIAPASGKGMCSALTPADFTKAGVSVSRLREANLDDDRSAYCIYDGGKAEKIEFDIFYPAGDTPAEAQNAEKAAQAALGGSLNLSTLTAPMKQRPMLVLLSLAKRVLWSAKEPPCLTSAFRVALKLGNNLWR